MNVICLTSHVSPMSQPSCHVERSETSLDLTRPTAGANNLTFFASLRMTATRGLRPAN